MLAIANMDARVTLYMADGAPYLLPVVHIPASGVVSIAVNDALIAAPANVTAHLSSWGSASVSYNYDWQGVILATTSLLDLTRSLEYTYPFIFPHSDGSSAAGAAMTLEGLWWRPTPNPHLFVALKNKAAQSANVAITVLDSAGSSISAQNIAVPTQGTALTPIDMPVNGAVGGLRVQYSGGMDSLLAAAGIEDDTAGFSANVPLTMPGMTANADPAELEFASS